MAICHNCGGDPDCTHKPELSAQLATQAARIRELEGALASLDDLIQWSVEHNILDPRFDVAFESLAHARRILAEGSVSN